jgi:hypothetical protein
MRENDGRIVEAALALCWIPFAATGWLLGDDTGRIAWFVFVTLLISFAHQPLRLALGYGDRRNFALRRRVFTWSPLGQAVYTVVILTLGGMQCTFSTTDSFGSVHRPARAAC